MQQQRQQRQQGKYIELKDLEEDGAPNPPPEVEVSPNPPLEPEASPNPPLPPMPSSELANLKDLEEDGGFDPILKFNKKSQGEYNIIVKLQIFCLTLLRIYGYIHQNKNDYYFGIKFHNASRLHLPDIPEFVPHDYEMKLVWQRSEGILHRAVQPFIRGKETRDNGSPFFYSGNGNATNHFLYKRSNDRLTVEDKPPGFFLESGPFLPAPPNARPYSKTFLKITGFQPPDGNRSVDMTDGEEKIAYVPKSPGVKDEVTEGTFEILCIDVHKFKSVSASGKRVDSFIGPPGSWFYDGDDSHHARQYAIVIGLAMLKMIEIPHAGDFDSVKDAIQEIKHVVERILTVYCGGNLWRELLENIEIEMEGYVEVPKFLGGKTKKNKIKNNKNKKIKSKKTKSKKNKSKKNKSKKIKSKKIKSNQNKNK